MELSFTSASGCTYTYPKNITEDIGKIEGKLIGCISQDLSIMANCQSLTSSSMYSEEARVFFEILHRGYELGVEKLDVAVIDSIISKSETLKTNFIKCNGFNAIMNLQKAVSVENSDTYIRELSNKIASLSAYQLTVDLQEKLQSSSEFEDSDEMMNYIDYRMAEMGRNIISDNGIQSVMIDDQYIKDKKDKVGVGTPYGLPLLSKATMGLHMGNFSLLSANTNVGKSTIMFTMIAMYILDHNPEEKILLYCNESEMVNIQDLLLMRTMSYHVRDNTHIDRNQLAKGDYTVEQEQKIAKARKYIEDNYKDRILFKKAERYSVNEFISIVRRYSYRGFRHFFLDTYKSENPSSTNVRGELIGSSRRIYESCRQLGVNVFATYQTAPRHKEAMRRGMDESILSEAKAIAEVLDILITCRFAYDKEYTNESYDLKPFKWVENPMFVHGVSDPKVVSKYVRKEMELDPTKKYVVVYLAKSRYGAKDLAFLYEANYRYGTIKEIGYCHIHSD